MLGKVEGQSDRVGTWEPGSGDASGDCDDEDGCQGSGEGDLKEDNIIAKNALSTEGNSNVPKTLTLKKTAMYLRLALKETAMYPRLALKETAMYPRLALKKTAMYPRLALKETAMYPRLALKETAMYPRLALKETAMYLRL
ncbi:hypothetical protein EOD39_13981 [Acipenser ruthenus]|uniref:Uncharacterized protein n=1 Tax=Acipenser ruthenus TaxID=7906 RepID=A0A662YMZ1_ACIRT|nr:hypothetical protein EOD39_13981 [Acipenser ruthenus]